MFVLSACVMTKVKDKITQTGECWLSACRNGSVEQLVLIVGPIPTSKPIPFGFSVTYVLCVMF